MKNRCYRHFVLGLLLAGTVVPASEGLAVTASWSEGPEVDAWIYGSSTGNAGTRSRAPTFSAVFIDPDTNTFERFGEGEATRLGMGLYGFETTDQVAAGFDPARYAIESVTLTVWANKAGPSTSQMIYTDQPKTADALLSEALSGGISPAQPMELFGVGFRSGYYDGFALGIEAGGDRYSESSNPYPGGQYGVYPVIGDGNGGYTDMSNSYTGGFSATSFSNETDPFTATPWSIGTTDATPGDSLTGINTFTFELDLNQPGALGYLQQSLSEGVVGFMLSSMHAADQQGFGGPAYPDWRTREGASGTAFPSLAIEYAILPAVGDYNGDGTVDANDHGLWTTTYGSSVAVGVGADGNRNGMIDAADYTVWRDAFDATNTAIAVPEPTASVHALAGVGAIVFCVGTVTLTTPRRPQ